MFFSHRLQGYRSYGATCLQFDFVSLMPDKCRPYRLDCRVPQFPTTVVESSGKEAVVDCHVSRKDDYFLPNILLQESRVLQCADAINETRRNETSPICVRIPVEYRYVHFPEKDNLHRFMNSEIFVLLEDCRVRLKISVYFTIYPQICEKNGEKSVGKQQWRLSSLDNVHGNHSKRRKDIEFNLGVSLTKRICS